MIMENLEFENQMKRIMKKASDASNISFEDLFLVNGDPDFVADFGCDHDGYLVLEHESFPLKIKDLTEIRYRWSDPEFELDSFFRFNFGKNIYIDFCIHESIMGHYNVKYHGIHKYKLIQRDAISLIQQCVDSENK